MDNPKLAGSNIIDCIPQTGECPMQCPECFYNGGRFYRPLDTRLIPTVEESRGKIVRVNSGHDSNIDREKVITAASCYKHAFFNTSIPKFDFPGPVVFTSNGKVAHYVKCGPNVMFVRVRANTWDLDEQDALTNHYLAQRIPVVMTFMAYYHQELVKEPQKYEWRKRTINEYWCITPEARREFMLRYKGVGVRTCTSEASSLCVDCRNCELLYWECLRKMRG